jgi:hypothetical protein
MSAAAPSSRSPRLRKALSTRRCVVFSSFSQCSLVRRVASWKRISPVEASLKTPSVAST